jgi:hypothetical protein
MLLPLAASAALLYRALDTYPRDVASAAASADATDEWSWDESGHSRRNRSAH